MSLSKRGQRLLKDAVLRVVDGEWLTVTQIVALMKRADVGVVDRYLRQMTDAGELETTQQISAFGRMARHYRRSRCST